MALVVGDFRLIIQLGRVADELHSFQVGRNYSFEQCLWVAWIADSLNFNSEVGLPRFQSRVRFTSEVGMGLLGAF